MSPGVQRYLDMAKECERKAAQLKDREAALLTKDAWHWRDLARQAENWERIRDMMPGSLRHNHSTLLPPVDLCA